MAVFCHENDGRTLRYLSHDRCHKHWQSGFPTERGGTRAKWVPLYGDVACDHCSEPVDEREVGGANPTACCPDHDRDGVDSMVLDGRRWTARRLAEGKVRLRSPDGDEFDEVTVQDAWRTVRRLASHSPGAA